MCVSSSWHNILTISPTVYLLGWAIIEELSIRRRLRTFLISWGLKTRVKHYYVDLSSWYELWFAVCTSFLVFIPQSNNFRDGFRLPGSTRWIFIEIILAPMCLCRRKMWKSNVKKNIFLHPALACHSLSPRGYSKEFPADCAITYYVSTQGQSGKTS